MLTSLLHTHTHTHTLIACVFALRYVNDTTQPTHCRPPHIQPGIHVAALSYTLLSPLEGDNLYRLFTAKEREACLAQITACIGLETCYY